jgi:hypothetical protein
VAFGAGMKLEDCSILIELIFVDGLPNEYELSEADD